MTELSVAESGAGEVAGVPAVGADDRLIEQLIAGAQAGGLRLTGEGGLLQQLTQRLNQLGIRPNQARSTALFQLATEIPARTLGIDTDVAVAWQRLSAGDWANYAAEVSQRTTSS
ncbi:hypothetical protein [Streptomyces sp. NBC_01618]|uniref:hypothetical protein n=1 Tax=Streptomyces sp. NBC_01618 TaxID=2975900 RepID=UPI0038649CDE|nr:hypothetical protein OH735_37800 [Streptomyces sp. NBC_01618]